MQLLNDVLAYPTVKHRLRSNVKQSPSSFLSSVFFPRPSTSRSKDPSKSFTRGRNRRSRSFPLAEVPLPPEPVEGTQNADADIKPERPVRPPLHPHPLGAYSDPGLLTIQQASDAHLVPISDTLLPRAVVLSGLEHATIPCQRALTHVLLQRKIVLEDDEELGEMNSPEWKLPEDFMFVLVCPWDPRERPGVYKGIVSNAL